MPSKYTFLVPAYKGRYLKEALDSILSQTYKDFKVIVSDDCSPENLKVIIDGYDDDRLSYRRNDENIGGKDLVAHWNLLVDICETEYLIMASDDDVYDSHFLEEIDKLTMAYPDVNVLRSRVQFIDAEGDVYMEDPAFEEHVNELKWLKQNYTPHMLKCMANYVFRTNTLKAKGGFINYPLAWYSDIATVLMMGDSGGANTKDILFTFRMSGLNISSEQQTTVEAARKKMNATYAYDKWMLQHLSALTYEHNKLNDSIYQSLFRSHKDEIVIKFVNYAKALSFRELCTFIRERKRDGYFDSGLRIYWVVKEWIRSRNS